MSVVLISCVAEKRTYRCKAKDLYISRWFLSAWKYARSLNPDNIFILSAKHGLVDPEAEIEPYEETLNNKSDRELRTWSSSLLAALSDKTDVTNEAFIILAGEKYRKYLIDHFPNHKIPMKGLRIGEQLKWLKEHCPQ
jgi:hypothetical protein